MTDKPLEHQWIWDDLGDEELGIGDGMYCFWCLLERDFSVDEEDEPPCDPRKRPEGK